jgi:threonine synthase
MQKMQMTTQEGQNVNVVAVKGNFDDCQTAVKKIFTS